MPYHSTVYSLCVIQYVYNVYIYYNYILYILTNQSLAKKNKNTHNHTSTPLRPKNEDSMHITQVIHITRTVAPPAER